MNRRGFLKMIGGVIAAIPFFGKVFIGKTEPCGEDLTLDTYRYLDSIDWGFRSSVVTCPSCGHQFAFPVLGAAKIEIARGSEKLDHRCYNYICVHCRFKIPLIYHSDIDIRAGLAKKHIK